MSHMNYCITSWASACKSTLKSLDSTYKQAIKVLDRKHKMYHHRQILEKLELLDMENTVKYTDSILVFKILHGLAPPHLHEYIKRNINSMTRVDSRGNCSLLL